MPWFCSTRSRTQTNVLPLRAVTPTLPTDGSVLPESTPARSMGKLARFDVSMLQGWWGAVKERLGTGSALSESYILDPEYDSGNTPEVAKVDDKTDNEPEGPIDEVVVDRLTASDGATHKSPTDPDGTGGTGGSHERTDGQPVTNSGAESLNGRDLRPPMSWIHGVWTTVRWRMVPTIHGFFVCQFHDEKMEAQFRREAWFANKRLALWASLFYVLNWVIGCVLLPRPHPVIEITFYYGLAPVLTLPLPFFVALDFPRHHNVFYQIYLACSTWSWPIYQCLFLVLCGLYGQHIYFPCDGRDFLGMLYYASALPAIALFGLGLHRFPALAPTLTMLVIMAVGIVPFRHTFARTVVNVFVSQMFYLWLHYLRENTDRRLYSMREQVKIQFRATQKAQINERKAADSKRRLTSYIFHEVRVPLNTALLAVQNMGAHGSIPKGQDIEFAALEGSLSMMSKVLNDVLDFNRMDSGRFESVNRPYQFHTVLRSMLVPLQLAADARGLTLVTEIDKRIDEVAKRAWYRAQELATPAFVETKMAENPNEEGIVLGDEMRFRQIVTNLASNACKFTPSGGKISIRTMLVSPADPSPLSSPYSPIEQTATNSNSLSTQRLSQHETSFASSIENIVVRIEIEDTGPGIRARDLEDNKLFSPYVQTEIGRTQGGKGTGLGLALVRHIVKLSKGRLGVRSQLGLGSTFWVELRLGVGKRALLHGNGSDSVKTYNLEQSTQNLKRERVEIKPTTNEGSLFTPVSEYPGFMESHRASDSYAGLMPLFPTHTVSALKRIMDQGGLVELAPRRSETGDHPTLSPSLPFTGSSSADYDRDFAPIPVSTSNSGVNTPGRPTYIALPENASSYFPPTPNVPPSPGVNRALTQHSSSPDLSLHLDSPLNALVVDDDFVTRQLMSRLLTRLGVSVTCAENGAVAMELILGNANTPTTSNDKSTNGTWTPQTGQPRFDIIFLDNQMPVMSGLEVMRRLRERGRTEFVVGVTGNALLSDQDEYIEAGVNRVLTKPVSERHLKSALNAADQLKKLRSTPISEQRSSLVTPKPLASDNDNEDSPLNT